MLVLVYVVKLLAIVDKSPYLCYQNLPFNYHKNIISKMHAQLEFSLSKTNDNVVNLQTYWQKKLYSYKLKNNTY